MVAFCRVPLDVDDGVPHAHTRDAAVLLRIFLVRPWLARTVSWLLLVLSPRLTLAKSLSDEWNDYWREYGVVTWVTVDKRPQLVASIRMRLGIPYP
ncbi:MAG: hypothetical protein ACXW5H_06415 [Thermoanaerobaculia bacterium]